MSPKMTARRRLEIALHAIGLAFDRDGVTVQTVAEELGVSEATVVDAVHPFTDLEYVHTAGYLLDDIGHVVTVQGGMISVQQNWMQDLTAVTPGDAALLLAMIEMADDIDDVSVEELKGLRRRLDAIAHVSIGEAVPPAVADLVSAKHAGAVISARYETSDMRVAAEASSYEVHEVRWTRDGWRVLVTPYGGSDDDVLNLAAERLHDISRTGERFERRSLTTSEFTGSGGAMSVDIEFPLSRKWLLGYFGPQIIEQSTTTAIARLRIDPTRPLSRLLLRLGPGARVVDPDDLGSVGSDAARRILGRYGNTA